MLVFLPFYVTGESLMFFCVILLPIADVTYRVQIDIITHIEKASLNKLEIRMEYMIGSWNIYASRN